MALFPLHLFSSSVLSQSPSPSNSLPIIHTRKTSPTAFNSHKFELSIALPTTELENKQYPETRPPSYVMKKKKKKPRPSFYDQTHERWSIKTSSQRTKFPWQEQKDAEEEEEEGGIEKEEQVLESSNRILHSTEEKGENLLLGKPLNFPKKNRKISAPWAHGVMQRKTHLDFADKLQGGGIEKKEKLLESSHSILNSIEGKGENPLLGKLMKNRKISAPWAHGAMKRKTHLDSAEKVPVLGQMRETHIDGEEDKGLEIHGQDERTAAVGNVIEILDSDSEEEQNSTSNGNGGDFTSSIVKKLKEFGGDAQSISLNEKRPGFNGNVPNFLDLKLDSSEEESRNLNGSKLMDLFDNGDSIRLPWERERGPDGEKWRRNNAELAEKTVPEPELRRLRNIALRMKERMKVGAAGITQTIVDDIREKWKEVEVVKIKFEGPPALNMKRTHNVLERKTGGLVIWRSGSSLVLYRGMTYELPCVQSYTKHSSPNQNNVSHSEESNFDARTTDESNVSSMPCFEDSYDEFTDIADVNNMLDELGPRFLDWSGCDPLPVDADLLPGVVPGYKPPFRLLPYGVRHCLHNKQMTTLRRLARTVPPHFALGRNREHQGLAKAIVKLWEKSAIAKIAIKRGVFNTCNERMAEEIKKLTGGTILSRNKDYIVFYRGNDFLSPAMKAALLERQKLAKLRQDEEEQARMKASDILVLNARTIRGPFVAGTLAETMEASSHWGHHQPNSEEREKMMRDEILAKHASLVRYLERKLANAQEKVKKAEKALRKVQASLDPADLPTDLETITDEERFLYRKIGLSMKPFLLLGRRDVFDGTVENMHLHWKYRELVKIIVKGKSFPQVKHVAISLEAESGGVLVSLDKTTKGYAIIVYRGKNYQRPKTLRPKNLLTRRQALARSIELQRREALNHHISDLGERIEMLKSELEQMESVQERDDRDLYSRLGDSYSSDDDLDDEGEEAYLKTYDSGDESGNSESEESASESESVQ